MTQPLAVIAILATAGASAPVIYGLYDVFRSAGHAGPPGIGGPSRGLLLEPVIVARATGTLAAGHGLPVPVQLALGDCRRPAVACVPDIGLAPEDLAARRHAAEIDWLRGCHRSGALVAGVGTGALLLAEAGLLDGEEATTHPASRELAWQRHPAVRWRTGCGLVTAGAGGRLVTAGGGRFWLDLALRVVERLAGPDEAFRLARQHLVDWPPPEQQSARAEPAGDSLIRRLQAWAADHYATDAPVSAMVQLSGLPGRSFQRRFKMATGMTPLEYIHMLRLDQARHLLETTSQPIEAVARAVGYDDAAFFGRLFRRKLDLTPAQYRRRFAGLRSAPRP